MTYVLVLWILNGDPIAIHGYDSMESCAEACDSWERRDPSNRAHCLVAPSAARIRFDLGPAGDTSQDTPVRRQD